MIMSFSHFAWHYEEVEEKRRDLEYLTLQKIMLQL
jgi:hypothetical protein